MLKDLCMTHYFVCYATDSQWHSQNSKNYIIDSPLYQALPPCFQICPSNMWHFLCWSPAQTRPSFPCWRWVHWAGSRDQTCARCRWTTWSGWGLGACSTAGCGRWTSARGRSPSGPWPTSAYTSCPPTNKSKAALLTAAGQKGFPRLSPEDAQLHCSCPILFCVWLYQSWCCKEKHIYFCLQNVGETSTILGKFRFAWISARWDLIVLMFGSSVVDTWHVWPLL